MVRSLQDELEDSMDQIEHESTPLPEPAKPKRGVKRTSEGRVKDAQAVTSIVQIEIPVEPKAKAAEKGKRGRKPKQPSTASVEAETAAAADVNGSAMERLRTRSFKVRAFDLASRTTVGVAATTRICSRLINTARPRRTFRLCVMRLVATA